VRDLDRDALFARARDGASPTEVDRARVRIALHTRLGVTAGVATSATAIKAAASVGAASTGAVGGALCGTAATTASSAVAMKVAVALLAVAAASVGGYALRRPMPRGEVTRAPSTLATITQATPSLRATEVPGAPRHATPTSRAPSEPLRSPPAIATPDAPLVQAATTAPVPRPAVVSAPARLATPVAAAPVAPSARVVTGLEAEPAPTPRATDSTEDLALVAAMQAALRSGDEARALALVEEHARRFPSSEWTPEREGARVLARCASPSSDERSALGRAFLAAYPRSPLGARVRVTCGLGAVD
jgi:hypothetical protein